MHFVDRTVKSGFWVSILILSMNMLQGQDAQFSQFYGSPMYLNPALTGSHSGTYRLMSSYRTQWHGAIEQPFTTFVAGGDIKFTLRNKKGSYSGGNDRAAVGMQFFSDRVGLFDYNTNHISAFGAYHKLLGTHTYLSGGFQLGLGQRGINYEDLTFQDQYNGVDQFTQPTAESLPSNSIGYGDLSIGIHIATQPATDKGFYLGVAYHHFNKPNTSFFDRDLSIGEEFLPFTIDPKLTLHGGFSVRRSRLLAIQPRAIFIKQGQASSTIVGSNLKYNFIDLDRVALHLGGWIRATDNLTTYQPTDLIISAGFEQRRLLIGFSYDYHLRDISGSSLSQNTFELTISFIGEHENEDRICPEF